MQILLEIFSVGFNSLWCTNMYWLRIIVFGRYWHVKMMSSLSSLISAIFQNAGNCLLEIKFQNFLDTLWQLISKTFTCIQCENVSFKLQFSQTFAAWHRFLMTLHFFGVGITWIAPWSAKWQPFFKGLTVQWYCGDILLLVRYCVFGLHIVYCHLNVFVLCHLVKQQ